MSQDAIFSLKGLFLFRSSTHRFCRRACFSKPYRFSNTTVRTVQQRGSLTDFSGKKHSQKAGRSDPVHRPRPSDRPAISPRSMDGRLVTRLNLDHDGWADGRLGDSARSKILLNDYLLIDELAGPDKEARPERLHALSDEADAHLRALLPEALGRFRRVIVLTQVPRFRVACWHRGRVSDDDGLSHIWVPSRRGGAERGDGRRPRVRDDGALRPHSFAGRSPGLAHLRVLTGGVEYDRPELERVLTVG